MGAYSKGGLFEGVFKIFLVVSRVPVEIFLLVNDFFAATYTSTRILLKDRQIFVN